MSYKWKPIETAPMDGSSILLLIDGQPVHGKYNNICDFSIGILGCGFFDYEYECEDDLPTHWCELPEMED